MTAKSCYHFFYRFIFLFNALWIQTCSTTKEGLGTFPIFISEYSRSSYYSSEKDSWQKSNSQLNSVKRLQAYDNFECLLQCSRMGTRCESINYRVAGTKTGENLCEVILADQHGDLTLNLFASSEHFILQPAIHKSCAEVYRNGGKANGVYKINPQINFPPMYVSCDMQTDQGGWTVIQRRIDGSVNFHRNWNEYKRGFGDKLGDYWLGLEIIHSLTSQGNYILRIDMEDFAGSVKYAKYNKFIIGDEKDNYRITVDQYSGDAGDQLRLHNNAQFSTKERDNDKSPNNCANIYKGGWWFNRCLYCNLNGEYFSDLSNVPKQQGRGIVWYSNRKFWEPLKRVEMKIRLKTY